MICSSASRTLNAGFDRLAGLSVHWICRGGGWTLSEPYALAWAVVAMMPSTATSSSSWS